MKHKNKNNTTLTIIGNKMCDCGDTKSGKYFSKVGGQIGDRLQRKGMSLANQAGKRFKNWSGLGDYNIVFNSLIEGSSNSNNIAAMSEGRGLIFKHKEYLGDIITSSASPGAFHVTKFVVNPGNVITFPWLASIAQQHDQYKPLGVIFEFVSTASDTTSSATLGSIVMSTQYDIKDPDPANKSDMLNRAYASEARMSQNMVHGLECDPGELQNDLFYTLPLNDTVDDTRFYNMANFYVATQGGNLPVSTIIGSLYVHYEYEFFKQIPFNGVPCKGNLYSIYSATIPAASGISITSMVPSLTHVSGRNLGITTHVTGNGGFIIPKYWQGASFMIEIFYRDGLPRTSQAAATMAFVNCTATVSALLPASNNYYLLAPRSPAITYLDSYTAVFVNINSNIASDAQVSQGSYLGCNDQFSSASGGDVLVYFTMVQKDYQVKA